MKLNWIFAVKYTLAILLAWYVSSYFGFDKPYWSMMTVAIIGYPDSSLSLAKMTARLAGSFIGVIAVTVIANISINDHWIFTSLLILWLSICLFLTLVSRYMMPYMFSLSGYTSAIIAFGTSMYPVPTTIFNLSQERLMEIMIGIIAYSFVSYILPNNKSEPKLNQIEKKIRLEKKQVLSFLFKDNITDTLKNLNAIITDSITYDETSKYESNFLSFRKKSSKIFKLPGIIAFTIIGLADKSFLHHKEYRRLLLLERNIQNPSVTRSYFYLDWKDTFLSISRLVLSLIISVMFWLNTDWEYGYTLAVLVSISFTFGITIPNADKLVFIIFIVAILIISLSYVIKFYFLIQASSFIQAAVIMIPFLLLLGVLKTISKLAFIISHVMCISLIFMINFTNPMNFDFTFFANTAIALIFSIIIVALMLYIIPLSSNQQVENKKANFIFNKLKQPRLDEYELLKIRNTIIMNITSFSDPKNINKLYVLISLISLYELTQLDKTKAIIVDIIATISREDDKDKILSYIENKDFSDSDINLKYAKEVIAFL